MEHTFRRDANSSGLINTDHDALAAYKKHRDKMMSMEQDINNIKEQLATIMSLLHNISRG
jgi:hypothetical protein